MEALDPCWELKAQWSTHRPWPPTTVLSERDNTYLLTAKWDISYGALGSSRPVLRDAWTNIEEMHICGHVCTRPGCYMKFYLRYSRWFCWFVRKWMKVPRKSKVKEREKEFTRWRTPHAIFSWIFFSFALVTLIYFNVQLYLRIANIFNAHLHLKALAQTCSTSSVFVVGAQTVHLKWPEINEDLGARLALEVYSKDTSDRRLALSLRIWSSNRTLALLNSMARGRT